MDVCIANEEDAADVFGIHAANTDVTAGEVNHEGYKDVAKQLADRFGFEKVAITLRESISANDNNWSAMLYDGTDYFFSKKYKMHIVDRVGGGDSFGGGLIAATLSGYDSQATIEFAVAASCLKHSIEGDFNMVSMDEVAKLADVYKRQHICRATVRWLLHGIGIWRLRPDLYLVKRPEEEGRMSFWLRGSISREVPFADGILNISVKIHI